MYQLIINNLFFNIAMVFLSIVLLWKGAEWLVDSAIPLDGNPKVAVGNVFGSYIYLFIYRTSPHIESRFISASPLIKLDTPRIASRKTSSAIVNACFNIGSCYFK